MEEFFARLREHKLVQWTLGYVAVSFALIPVLDIVAQNFGWPRATVRCIIIALITGFFMMLVIAWYHGERGAQRITRTEHAILATLLVLGVLTMWWLGPAVVKPLAAKPVTVLPTVIAPKPIAPAPIDPKSVAVLPFENLSADKDNAYFADGMQDLILTKLADIGDLKVISRTSTAKYSSHPDDLKAIAQQLGVATILEGSVQKAGNQVLINVQLIDAQTDNHLWADAYQRTLDNIFGVEGEVAQKIAKALKAKLTPVEAAAIARIPTQNKQAYDAYLKANYYRADSNRTLDRGELERSITLAKQAIQLDPNFVDAYNLLALDYIKLGGHNDQAEAASRRALALAPNNANALMDLGSALMHRGDYAAAIAQAQEAVRLRPAAEGMRNGLGYMYAVAGRFDESSTEFKHAIELAPAWNLPRENLAQAQMARRRYAEARDTLRVPVARDPADLQAAINLAQTWVYGAGDLDAARKVLQAVPTPVATSGALSDAWYWQDMYARDYADALVVIGNAPATWFANEHYPRELYQALVYQAQGDAAKASAAFSVARTQLETWTKSAPDNAELHALLALTLAGLGENAQALSEAKRATMLEPVSRNALFGPQYLIVLAQVNARIGDTDAAVKLLDQLLAMPAGGVISVPLLKLAPAWDPTRNDPSFQALLKKYESDAATNNVASDKAAARD